MHSFSHPVFKAIAFAWLATCLLVANPSHAVLISYWDFEGDFLDSVGTNHLTAHAYTGTLATAIADGNDATTGAVAGRSGQSLILDGIADGLSTAASTSLDFGDNSSFTIAMWVKLQPNTYDNNITDAPGDGRSSLIFRDTAAAPFNGYSMTIDHQNGTETATTQFLRGTIDGGLPAAEANFIEKNTNIVSDVLNDAWHHVAYVVKDVGSAAGTTTLYLDGAVVQSSTNLSTLASNGDGGLSAGSVPFFVGSERANGSRWAKGAMDDVAVWNDALPAGSILGLFQNTLTPDTVPIPGEVRLLVDRTTGNVTLTNTTSTAVTNIVAYTISSAEGALNATDAVWSSIADTNANWEELSNPAQNSEISEFEKGPLFTGITLGANSTRNFGNVWLKHYKEDVQLTLAIDDGTPDGLYLPVSITYVGGSGNFDVPFEFGDLNFDGVINSADLTGVLMANYKQSSAGLSVARQYAKGDLNNDGITNIVDFSLLNEAYIATLAPGSLGFSFTSVPEPGTVSLAMMGLVGLVFARFRRQLAVATLSCVALLGTIGQADAVLISYWDFEGATPLNDKSGNPTPHHLTAVGNATVGAKVGRTALLLDGTGDSAATPGGTDSEFEMGTSSFTIAGWYITNDTTPVRSGVFSYSDDTTVEKSGYYFDTRNTAEYDGRAILDDGPTSVLVEVDNDSTAYNTTVWQHLALTVNRTTGLAKVYLNGVEQDSENISALGSLNSNVAALNFVLGDHPSITGRDLNGALDDWAIWKGDALSGSAVRTLHEGTRTPLNVETLYDSLNVIVNTNSGDVSLVNNFGLPVAIDSYTLSSATPSAFIANSLTGGFDATNRDGSGTWFELEDSTTAKEEGAFGQFSTFADGFSQSLGTSYNTTTGAEDLVFTYHIEGDPASQFYTARVFYEGTTVLQGDFNNDGIVNLADYTVWRDNLGGNESALNGNGNNLGVVDAADYQLWKTNFGMSSPGALASVSSNVPEPGSWTLLGLGLAGVMVRRKNLIKGVGAAAACFLMGLLLIPAANAAYTLEREYLFGDIPGEGDAIGAPGPQTGEVVNSGAANPVFDNTSPFVDLGLPPDNDANPETPQTNIPTYHLLTAGDIAAGNPNAVGSSAAAFDQATVQYVRRADMPLNKPGTASASQGIQVWAYVNGATLTSTVGQVLVFDTVNNGGPAITADGKWTQLHSGHVNLAGTVAVVPNTWQHVAQHIYLNTDDDAPNLVPGTGTTTAFTSVIYVNGVAVSANNDASITASGGFAVGAVISSGLPTAPFGGLLDSLEVYSSTANQFDLFADNEFIAGKIAAIPGGVLKMGDVNRDGLVNSQDVTNFVAGWASEKKFAGAHNSMYVGDWQTWGWGDLNIDGQVNLHDALLFNRALKANGAGALDFSLLGFGPTSVPEPATCTLALLLFGTGLYRARMQFWKN